MISFYQVIIVISSCLSIVTLNENPFEENFCENKVQCDVRCKTGSEFCFWHHLFVVTSDSEFWPDPGVAAETKLVIISDSLFFMPRKLCNCVAVTELTILAKNLRSIDSSIFIGCSLKTKLITLKINKSSLKTIPASAFGNLYKLGLLSLQNNLLESLDDEAFVNLSRLETLQIKNTQLTHLNATVFHPLTNLKTLELENNNIATLDSFLLKKNNILENFIYSSFTQFFEPKLFEELDNFNLELKYLNDGLNNNLFFNVTQNIRQLKLENYNIKYVNFTNSNLDELQLIRITIDTDINSALNFPTTSVNLKKLLVQCNHTNMDTNPWRMETINYSDLTELKEIKLFECQIDEISCNTFENNKKLEMLSIMNAEMTTMEDGFIKTVKANISDCIFGESAPALKFLFLDGNYGYNISDFMKVAPKLHTYLVE